MLKAAVLVLADVETHGDRGRIANALMTAKEFKEANDEVRLVFDGAATQWPVKLAQPDHKLHRLYMDVRDRVAGACEYCAGAFGAKAQLQAIEVPLLDEQEGIRVSDGSSPTGTRSSRSNPDDSRTMRWNWPPPGCRSAKPAGPSECCFAACHRAGDFAAHGFAPDIPVSASHSTERS